MTIQTQIFIDALSLSSLKIVPVSNGVELSVATGFGISINGQNFIVTNWHVVSGRNAETEVCLDPNLAIPESLKLHLHSSVQLGQWVEYEYQLFDEHGVKVWWEHPSGREIDVVLLPVPQIEGVNFYTIHNALTLDKALLAPAYPVSVIGYPLGLSVGGNWPIWKTGHVATDPDIDCLGKPVILIDATTRGGMSGSPVVIRTKGPYIKPDGVVVMSGSNYVTSFVGVYSGRTSDQSELGRVWKFFVIDSIYSANHT